MTSLAAIYVKETVSRLGTKLADGRVFEHGRPNPAVKHSHPTARAEKSSAWPWKTRLLLPTFQWGH